MHHPLSWLSAFDQDDARRELESKGVIALTGHEHEANPTSEVSVRGRAIYGRAGCLFQGRDARQVYAIVDVDFPSRKVTFKLRSWFPERGGFGTAEDILEGGEIQLELPAVAPFALAPMPNYTQVASALAGLAQESSLAPVPSLPGMPLGVSDVIVEPRFYRAPFEQLASAEQLRADRAVGKRPSIPRVDPMSVLADHSVILVSGGPQSGLSDSLYWLLARSFASDAERLPICATYRPLIGRNPVERLLREQAPRLGFLLDPDAELPAVTAAIDDIDTSAKKHLDRLVAQIASRPQDRYILGCHGDEHSLLSGKLRDAGVEHERLFLGPFGPPELKSLVKRLVGDQDEEMTDRILDVAFSHGLPRTPFVMSTLAVVLVNDPDYQTLNESTILDSYTRILVGQTEFLASNESGLDVRNREHILGSFARWLRSTDSVSALRGDVESWILSYFDSKGWGRSRSAGRVLEDLVDRRILVEEGGGVIRFRHAVLQHLYLAKQMLEDEEFFDEVLTDPMLNFPAVRHAAAIKRSDRALLRRVGEATVPIIEEIGNRVPLALFDSIQDPDALTADPDVDQLARQLQYFPTYREIRQARESMYEEMEVRSSVGSEPADDSADRGGSRPEDLQAAELAQALEFLPAVGMLSEVLASSELVDDMALKTELLEACIRGWSLAIVMLAVREGLDNSFRALFEDAYAELAPQDAEGADEFREFVDWVVGLALTLAFSLTVAGRLGVHQLDGSIRANIENSELMEASAPALLLRLVAARAQTDEWVAGLRSLLERHGTSPFIRRIVHVFSLWLYHAPSTSEHDLGLLEGFLADITAARTGSGPTAVQDRAAARSRALQELQKSRQRVLYGVDPPTDPITGAFAIE